MIDPSVERELLEQLQHLPTERQRQVLEFARNLAVTRPIGLSGLSYLGYGGTIEPADLDAMSQAIDVDCEQVRPGEW